MGLGLAGAFRGRAQQRASLSKERRHRRYTQPASLLIALAGLVAIPALAQNQGLVVRDGTLGSAAAPLAVESGIDPLGQAADYLITPELGEQRGANLFHSFSAFGIGLGETATFTGPDPVTGPQSVTNVIGRVTGGSASQIDGTLRVAIPGADFWLVNPSGIVFGSGARLDVSGSLHASTADYLGFAGGLERYYADPAQPSVLSVAQPASFGFLGAPADAGPSLRVEHGTLAVPAGESLSFIARAGLTIEGGQLLAENGRVNLASVAGAGEVRLPDASTTSPLDAASFASLGEVTFTAGARAIVDGATPGSVFIRGGRVVIAQNSLVWAMNFGPGDGGRIDVEARESLAVDRSFVFATGFAGAPGTIDVRGGSVDITNGGNLWAGCQGCTAETANRSPEAGLIRIRGTALILDGLTGAPSPNPYFTASMLNVGASGGSGDAGRLELEISGLLRLTNHGLLFAGSNNGATGAGGSVSLQAGSLEMGSRALMHVGTAGAGNAGTIEISAETVRIGREAVVQTNTTGPGSAGRIEVHAAQSILIDHEDGAQIFPLELWTRGSTGTTTNLTGIHSGTINGGVGGSIFLDAPEITVVRGAGVSTGSVGGGDAGHVLLRGQRIRILDGGSVASASFVNPISGLSGGNAGSVTIIADESLEVAGQHPDYTQASSLSSVTVGSGAAGEVLLRAPLVLVDGARIATTALPFVDGREGLGGGGIRIEAGDLVVRGGGRIDASTFVSGQGGTVAVDATGSVTIEATGSEVAVRSGANSDDLRDLLPGLLDAGLIGMPGITGDGGDIAINAQDRVLVNGGAITASVEGGSGGNIAIGSDLVIVQNGGRIVAQADTGSGGNIDIAAASYFASGDSVVDASSRLGIDGSVAIHAPDADLSGALAGLPSSYLDPSALLRERCAARVSGARAGSFTVSGGGIPAPPDGPLASAFRAAGARTVASPAAKSEAATASAAPRSSHHARAAGEPRPFTERNGSGIGCAVHELASEPPRSAR